MIGASVARMRMQKRSPRNFNLLTSPKTPESRRRRSAGALISTEENGSKNSQSPTHLGVPGASSSLPQRKRSGSVPVIRFTLATAWGVKPDFVRGLKITWSRLCDIPRSNCRGISAIMENVFEKFETKQKTVKEVFYNSAFVDSMHDHTEKRRSAASIVTLRDHIHFFVSLISQVIQSLDQSPQVIFEHIDKIGCFHTNLKKYGFKAAMWDKLGECLIDALVVQDCVRGFPDACKAWTILVAALIDRLRSAPLKIKVPIQECRILDRPISPLPSPFESKRISPTINITEIKEEFKNGQDEEK
uniref:Globin family profile domain-containing protein n=1 Tax=Acrobeloides nanus TaxID=290746 RepID=A0A914ERS0_9BILA